MSADREQDRVVIEDKDKIHRTLKAAARGELVSAPESAEAYVSMMLSKCFRGEIAEFKVVNTRRGLDIFTTSKRRL